MADRVEHEVVASDKPRANDLDGKTWTRYSISIWSDLRKTSEETKLKHPVMFPLALASRAIACFTSAADRVALDPFAGVGTTIIAARDAGKQGIGIEISREFAEIANERVRNLLPVIFDEIEQPDDQDDQPDAAQQIPPIDMPEDDKGTPKRSSQLSLLSPLKLQGGGSGTIYRMHHLGKIADYAVFLNELAVIMQGVFTSLRPGKYCLIVVMDICKKSRFYPFHSDLAEAMEKSGFIYDDLIIWDRQHEYNNMRPLGYPYKFRINKAHEYILIFQKPN